MWTFVSRDGGTLLFNSRMSGSRNLWMMPLAGSHRPRQLTTVPGDSISHSSLSPDGHRLAFASISGGSSRVWTQNVDGTDLRPLTDATGAAWPVWSPDGEWILYSSVRTDGAQETWRVPAAGGAAEKIIDGFFRGDWVSQPSGSGSWVVSSIGGSGGVRLLDFERRKVLWEERFPDSTHLPMFSSDRTMISLPFPEGRDHDAIRVYDAASGKSRVAARLPFHVLFRADWVDDDKAFIVNRSDPLTHIVLLDRFWSGNTTLP
jgi:WD40 repeat protein